jgi:hypothetical protein
MAYDFSAASNTNIGISGAPASGAPMTIACWFYPKVIGSAGGLSLCQVESGSPNFRGNYLQFTSGDGVNNNLRIGSSGSLAFFSANGPSTFTTNLWVHCAGVVTSTTSRQAYVNGTGGSVNTQNCGTIDAATRAFIGNATLSNIAEVGIWNVALTAVEIASLAKGMTCNLIRLQSLVFYAPLIRNLQDVKGGRTLTNSNGAIVANHPRVYR